jgi:hypothetical protein
MGCSYNDDNDQCTFSGTKYLVCNQNGDLITARFGIWDSTTCTVAVANKNYKENNELEFMMRTRQAQGESDDNWTAGAEYFYNRL